MTDRYLCPNCRAGTMEIFYRLPAVPTNSCILLPSPQAARDYPRGEIALGFCPECAFISNVAFKAELTEYSARYEETQGFSPTFNAFHQRLAQRLIDRHNLRGKTIVEIGCGKGEFLNLVCELGGNRGIGFDPGYVDGRNAHGVADVRFIKDFYSPKYADYKGDFICCKMTLEHVPATANFVSAIRHTVHEDGRTVIFFQVPEATRIVRDCAFEDIYYEHCSYFCASSLARLFYDSGFRPLHIASEYDNQYLTIEASPSDSGCIQRPPPEENLKAMKQYVSSFSQRCAAKRGYWQALLNDRKALGRKTILWGSGSKGVSFLSSLDLDDHIEYVVDINPHRQRHYMPGTAQQIVGPVFLKEYKPDLVIVMNRIYRDEIKDILAEMGLRPELLAL